MRLFARRPVGPIATLPIENQMNEDLWWYEVHANRSRAVYRAFALASILLGIVVTAASSFGWPNEVSIVLGLLVSLIAGLQAASGTEAASVRFWRTFGLLRSEWSAWSNDAGPYFDVDRARKQSLVTQRWNAIVNAEYRAWEVAGNGRDEETPEDR